MKSEIGGQKYLACLLWLHFFWRKLVLRFYLHLFYSPFCLWNIHTSISLESLLRHLPASLKLKLIALLSECVASDYAEENPHEDWRNLFGAWEDTDEDMSDQVPAARLPNRDVSSFDG